MKGKKDEENDYHNYGGFNLRRIRETDRGISG
jgi:hypothetical protein